MSVRSERSSNLSARNETDSNQKSLIVIIGLMGSGKTTVGRELAKKLKVSFADSDELVEERAKLSVREIFSKFGEPEFRRFETDAIRFAISDNEPKVLAVAGGAVLADINRDLLAENSRCIVWLDAPTSTLVGRTGRAKHRPLLDGDATGALNKMRVDRERLYQQIATHKVATQSRSVSQVVAEVLKVCKLPNDMRVIK